MILSCLTGSVSPEDRDRYLYCKAIAPNLDPVIEAAIVADYWDKRLSLQADSAIELSDLCAELEFLSLPAPLNSG